MPVSVPESRETNALSHQARETPYLSILMVSHNSEPLLQRSLLAALAQSVVDERGAQAEMEIILVDNASRAGQLEQLPVDPRLRLLLNPDNRGFAVACNQAAAIARGEMLLFLNPDCQLPDGAVGQLLGVQQHHSVGLLGACLHNEDGSVQAASYRRDPKPLQALAQALGRARAGRTLAAAGAADGGICEIEAISGALMLISAEHFTQIGQFDQGFRLHVEDLDLCRRARQAGLRVAVANAVHVTHVKGSSSRERPVWVELQKHRGMWRYFSKHDADSMVWPLRVLLWLGLWSRFALVAPLAWLRARRGGQR